MLLIKNNLDVQYKQDYFDYVKSLVRPHRKSNIIVINYSGNDLGITHRDVYDPKDMELSIFDEVVEKLDYAYLDFLLVFTVDPGVPVLDHVHRWPGSNENHFQSVVGLSPDNDITGFRVMDTVYDLTGHNHVLLNVKLNHYVEPQEKPYMWFTSFGSRMK